MKHQVSYISNFSMKKFIKNIVKLGIVIYILLLGVQYVLDTGLDKNINYPYP